MNFKINNYLKIAGISLLLATGPGCSKGERKTDNSSFES